MNFFVEDTEDIAIKHHGLWVEKYRPNKVDEYICDDLLRETLEDFIQSVMIELFILSVCDIYLHLENSFYIFFI